MWLFPGIDDAVDVDGVGRRTDGVVPVGFVFHGGIAFFVFERQTSTSEHGMCNTDQRTALIRKFIL
jgi:hypothetical protein